MQKQQKSRQKLAHILFIIILLYLMRKRPKGHKQTSMNK